MAYHDRRGEVGMGLIWRVLVGGVAASTGVLNRRRSLRPTWSARGLWQLARATLTSYDNGGSSEALVRSIHSHQRDASNKPPLEVFM